MSRYYLHDCLLCETSGRYEEELYKMAASHSCTCFFFHSSSYLMIAWFFGRFSQTTIVSCSFLIQPGRKALRPI